MDGPLVGNPSEQWIFGINTGGDLSIYFCVEDVQEVVIPFDPETVQVFKRAPFKVTIMDQ